MGVVNHRSQHRRRSFALAVALLVIAAQPFAGVAKAHGSGAWIDETSTRTLGVALASARSAHGREPLFLRGVYRADARRIAIAVAEGRTPPPAHDGAAVAVRTVQAATTETVRSAARVMLQELSDHLASAYVTDTGWAAARVATPAWENVTLVAVVGLPAAPVTRERGCSSAGFCWEYRGLHPHLPDTRNRVRWQVSTTGLPPGAAAVVRDGAARLNTVSGLGADSVYAGTTSATRWSELTRFLVVFGDSCRNARAVACTEVMTVEPTGLIVGARIVVMRDRYLRSGYSRDYWVGTIAHEIAHALGLGHYDRPYGGRLQLLHSSRGPNTVQAGDRAGLRTIAPPGALHVAVEWRSQSARVGERAGAAVRARSSGLGGLRAMRVDCLDASNRWRTVARVAGAWDITSRVAWLAWDTGSTPRTMTCRAAVQSKAAVAYSSWFRVGVTA